MKLLDIYLSKKEPIEVPIEVPIDTLKILTLNKKSKINSIKQNQLKNELNLYTLEDLKCRFY
jgi:hypothetical protein